MPTTFQLFDATLAQATPDVFGVWETLPTPEAHAVSFAAPGEAVEEVPVWSVNLSPDLVLAARQMDASLAQVGSARQGLATAQKRLEALIAHQRAEADVSFSVAAAEADVPSADQALLRALATLKEREDANAIHYGLFDPATKRVVKDEAEEKFKAVMERMTASLIYYAAVETKIDHRLMARTQISWVGDAKTIWQDGARPEQYTLHQRTLKLAIDSRNALMRTFGLTAQAALKLSVLLAMPGGALLALPAAWKYVNQILAEVGQYQALKQEKENN